MAASSPTAAPSQAPSHTTPRQAAPAEDRPESPVDSPLPVIQRRWQDVLRGIYKRINDDRLMLVAAGVVFYGLLALFPAISALVSSYLLFADGATINQHLSTLATLLPPGTFSVIQDQVDRVLARGGANLGTAFLFSMVLALWSANGGVKAIIDALNVVYDEREQRGFLMLNAVSLTFTLASLAAVLSAIGLVVAAPIALSYVGLGSQVAMVIEYGRWPALACLTLLGLAVLYRYAPSRRNLQWQWVSVGSVFATLTWIAGSALLSYYLSNFADYDATYGSLGAAIGLMIWMWMTTIVILVGAELNSEIEAHATGIGRIESDKA
ncbi:ribonuclease BN [Rhodopseudomonas palustris]|uniref:Ribonuclease BN n=1 Tax=Rhodopseudomonas palustris TaxID=1076 RepID=A0A0D7E1D6_RHOPL|nr:ribonuclease BN [Rhodopseudomonas palustris]